MSISSPLHLSDFLNSSKMVIHCCPHYNDIVIIVLLVLLGPWSVVSIPTLVCFVYDGYLCRPNRDVHDDRLGWTPPLGSGPSARRRRCKNGVELEQRRKDTRIGCHPRVLYHTI